MTAPHVTCVIIYYNMNNYNLQKNNGFPDNKVISMELMGKKELEKYKKKIMPFVQVSKVSKF